MAYRTALGCRKWIGVEATRGIEPKVGSEKAAVGAGFIDCLPPLEANTPEELDVIRHSPDTGWSLLGVVLYELSNVFSGFGLHGAVLWQPIVSELSREERTYLAAKLGASHAYASSYLVTFFWMQ